MSDKESDSPPKDNLKGDLKEESKDEIEIFSHKMQFQLYDSIGLPVPKTQFWVKLKIRKQGKLIHVELPVINFQTGPTSPDDPFTGPPGGYLVTSDGFLPEKLRPTDSVPRSWVVPCNNGVSLPSSFLNTLPNPISGYILSFTFYGGIIISAAGQYQNLIPPGGQVMMPTDVSYLAKKPKVLCKDFLIGPGMINITQFTDNRALSDGIRDAQINDAFGNLLVWVWADNSTVIDKTNGTMNLMVVTGKIKNGKLKHRKPVQLTNFPAGVMVWDTAVAINRQNKNNIVVSYAILDHSVTPTASFTARAISFDGG
ncbi:MAG TPA: hypothetical protein VKR58_05450, partial [Aquella sp.]|nr:hypothetical protein [Aquella sp.]